MVSRGSGKAYFRQVIMIKNLALLFTALFLYTGIQAQNEYRFQLNNGMEVYLVQDSSMKDFEISLALQGGRLWDRCKQTGTADVLAQLLLSANSMYPDPSQFEQAKNTLLPNLKAEVGQEYLRYYAQSNTLSNSISMLEEIIRYPEFSETAVEMAVARANQLLARQSLEGEENLDPRIWKEVFRENYCAYSLPPDSLLQASSFSVDSLLLVYKEHFRPDRSFLIIKGNVERNKTQLMLGDILEDWGIDPNYNITIRSHLFRQNQTIDHQQGINFTSTGNPKYFLAFQGPAFSGDYGAVIPGIIFKQILSNLSEKAPEVLRQNEFVFWQENLKYSNLVALEWSPEIENLGNFLEGKHELLAALTDSSLITERAIKDAKNALYWKHKESASKNVKAITEAWSSTNILFYLSFEEILMQVTKADVLRYQRKYIAESFPYELLEIKATEYFEQGIDTVFLPVNRSIESLEIKFAENSPKISEDAYPDLIALKQFLQNNPQYLVQVNGFADKSEYLKVKDPVLDSMIASYPNFTKVDSKMINPKFIRLDMARSLYVIKFLLDQGIRPERLSGTSTLVKSKEDEEKYKNRKINVSMTQIRSERYMRLLNENGLN